MEILLFLYYWCISVLVVLATMMLRPPRSGRQRDDAEWLLAIAFAWLICPFAIYDLLKGPHEPG